jgi:uncharacterized protein (DUF427 family)
VLAESASPVMVFETGLPTRYYLNRKEVSFDNLRLSDTVTSCPYKGQTSGYWNVSIGDATHPDQAWAYDFPARQLLSIAGLVAFYNERVDVTLEGEPLPRPTTHSSSNDPRRQTARRRFGTRSLSEVRPGHVLTPNMRRCRMKHVEGPDYDH